ncbi:MAG: sigma-70 family RNA polymerase sigma factor [Phycisphaerales bacterium]|nr:MAG: sigma-70 family RNA polymerase sigma factor [Phycisphaerales bacterium]
MAADMEWITTSTILQSLKEFHNQSAWQRFAERFRPSIVRFARKLGLSEAEAEDVAQETLAAFAAAYRDGRYDRDKGRLSRWLFGIAYRQAQRARTGQARRAGMEGAPENTSFWEHAPDEQSLARLWDQQWEQGLLEQCLRQVRQEVEPSTMRAFEAVALADRAPAAVAAETGLSVKAVYAAKYRVLKRIRELRAALEDMT